MSCRVRFEMLSYAAELLWFAKAFVTLVCLSVSCHLLAMKQGSRVFFCLRASVCVFLVCIMMLGSRFLVFSFTTFLNNRSGIKQPVERKTGRLKVKRLTCTKRKMFFPLFSLSYFFLSLFSLLSSEKAVRRV